METKKIEKILRKRYDDYLYLCNNGLLTSEEVIKLCICITTIIKFEKYIKNRKEVKNEQD